VPYLTPQDLPEGDNCRPLFIPAGSEWLALFGGALTELVKVWNWEDSGGLTVAETVAKMQEIIDIWYAGGCETCDLPEGGKIIRLGEDGHVQVLEDGEWITPTEGDYYIPPPEAREGGTEADQICLAAKNAVNVLEQMYESLSESWAESLSTAEAITAMIGVAISIVGFEFAPISFGIAAFVLWALDKLYKALDYLGADLWTEDFSRQMICFLIPCATNTDGVVTFDWDCFVDKLNSLADDFMLTELQLRLYAQVSVMLWLIGGVDGLNLAGSTTEITDDFCDCGCSPEFEAYPAGWGTVIDLGAGYWRIESSTVDGIQKMAIRPTAESCTGCWSYDDESFIGTPTYDEFWDCDDVNHVGHAPELTNHSRDYLANEDNIPFIWIFHANSE